MPVTYVDGHEVTTVFDIMLAQYGVGREGLPGTWAKDVRGLERSEHPGMAGADYFCPRRGCYSRCPRVRQERPGFRRSLHGLFGAGICQWYHADTTYRAILALLT